MRESRVFNEIFIRCLREHAATGPPAGLHTLVTGRTLSRLPEAAEFHGVVGYLYHCLKDLHGVRERTLALLEEGYRRALRVHLRALGDLAPLSEVLRGVGGPWIILDGPVLVESVYPHPGVRSYDRFEIVVSRHRFHDALQALTRAGCRMADPHASAESTRGSGSVDILLWHDTLAGLGVNPWTSSEPGADRFVPIEEALDRAREVSLNGISVPTLDPVDSLIYLALRLSQRAERRWGTLKDIDRTISTHHPDGRELTVRARRWGIAETVGRELWRVRRLLGTGVPPEVLRDLPLSGLKRLTLLRSGPMATVPSPRPSRGAPDRSPPGAVLVAVGKTGPFDQVEAALLALARPTPDPPAPMSYQAWETLLQLAERERVAPLVSSSLKALIGGRAPQTMRDAFARSYERASLTVSGAYATLGVLLRELRGVRVTPLLLKGAALARFTYADQALRPFGDLDLLIRVEDLESVHRVLLQMGYALVSGKPTTAADLAWRHARGYFDPGGALVSVDVHWRYSGYPYLLELDYGGLGGRAREAIVDEYPVLIPSAEDLVVASSIYLLREIWYAKPKFIYLRDLAEIVGRHRLDWDMVHRLASETPYVRTPLFLALAASKQLLGTPVPGAALEALRPLHSRRVARFLQARMCANVLRREPPLQAVLQVTLMRWLDDPSPLSAARWARTLLVVPRPLAGSQRRWLRRLWHGEGR